jgi:hypothetical protein
VCDRNPVVARAPRQPKRSDVDPAELEDYDRVVRRRVGIGMATQGDEEPDMGPYFGPLLTSPPLAAALARLGTFVRTAGERENSYSHSDRELVDQVLSADWHTNVVQLLHVPDGLAAGVRLEAIDALREGREEELTDDERQLVDHIRRVANGNVSDESYAGIEQRMGRRPALEYTFFIAFLVMTIRLHQALGFPDPPDEEIDRLLADFREGRRELPDFRVRLG